MNVAEVVNLSFSASEVYSAIEQSINDLPKMELINPSPFERPLLPHERFRNQK